MSSIRAYLFLFAAAAALPAGAQSVISARSGVIHFFDGAVFLAGQPLESHLGKYPIMAEGSDLRTADGRAEVLLTPGVFLRLGSKTAVRMLSNSLTDTRVEIVEGSAIVDSAEQGADTSVTLVYKDWKMRLLQAGSYRFDADPPRLWVQKGEAQVSASGKAASVDVPHGMDLPLAEVLVPEDSNGAPADALTDWARGRGESILADNAVTAQIDEDPATAGNSLLGLDGFTYFPMIGPSLALSPSGLYGAAPSQLGFYSIYLPGYTYRPLTLGYPVIGLRDTLHPISPSRIGVSPMRPLTPGAYGPGPRAPMYRSTPAPIHSAPAAPHAPAHVGGHR